jgi:hypothetical protein
MLLHSLSVFRPLLLLGAAIVLAACGSSSQEEETRASAAEEGRDETRLIRNTENIGVAGNAVGRKLDGALDANEQRSDQLDQQLQGSGEGE